MELIFFVPFLIFGGIMLVFLIQQDAQRRRQRTYWRSLPAPNEALPESPRCPKCRAGMARGYLLDRTHGGFGVGTWIEGPTGPLGWADLIRPRLERSIPIVSYRCLGCGFVELYARPELVEELDKGKPAAFSEL